MCLSLTSVIAGMSSECNLTALPGTTVEITVQDRGSFLSFEASNRQQCPHKQASPSPLCSGMKSLDDWPLGKQHEDSPFCHHEEGRIRKLVTVTVTHATQHHRTPFATPQKRQASNGRSIRQGL